MEVGVLACLVAMACTDGAVGRVTVATVVKRRGGDFVVPVQIEMEEGRDAGVEVATDEFI